MMKKLLIQDLSEDEQILITKYRGFSINKKKALKRKMLKMILHNANAYKKESVDSSKHITKQ